MQEDEERCQDIGRMRYSRVEVILIVWIWSKIGSSDAP